MALTEVGISRVRWQSRCGQGLVRSNGPDAAKDRLKARGANDTCAAVLARQLEPMSVPVIPYVAVLYSGAKYEHKQQKLKFQCTADA
jgi:hypothetical protein